MVTFENPNNKACQDCCGEVWAYMVLDSVWLQAMPSLKSHLCMACLSKRLRRPLIDADFQNVPINWFNVPGFGTTERMEKYTNAR